MKKVYVGKLCGTHGLKGEIKLDSDFVYLDKILTKDFKFYIGNDEEVSLLKFRKHNKYYLLTFTGYENIDLVEKFKNQNLYVSRDDLNLQKGEYVLEDYIGLKAYFNDKELGKVTDVIDYGMGNYNLEIGDILIPLNNKFIKEIILDDRIILKEVEGLIDED